MLPASLVSLGCCLLALVAPLSSALAEDGFAQEMALEAHMEQFLPRTLPKLQRRAQVRVTVVGDSISNFFQPVEKDKFDLPQAWHYRFLNQLAARFYYSGGVREDTPKPKIVASQPVVDFHAEDALEQLPPRGELKALRDNILGGPEILLKNQSRNGATAIQALQVLTTDGFDADPDLVVWMFGTNDADTRVPTARYAEALAAVIRECKAHQADLIVAGPPLIFGANPQDLSATQPYVETARVLAKQAGVLFVDASAALGRVPLPQPAEPDTALETYRKKVQAYYQYDHLVDRLHPNALGHEVIAEAAWQALVNDPTPDPLLPRGSFTLPSTTDGAPKLEITVFQPQTEVLPPAPMSGVVISVLGHSDGWQRADSPSFSVKEFIDKRQTIMPLQPLPETSPRLPLGDSTICSIILHEGTVSRLVNLTMPVIPLSLDLPVIRLEGVAGTLIIDSVVNNRQNAEFHGNADVTWLDNKISLDLTLPANSTKPLKFRLPLPKTSPARGPLRVTLNDGERHYAFERTIDAAETMLPDQKIALHNPAKTSPSPQVTFHAEALALLCRFELPPAKATPDAPIAALITLAIDARSPADRAQTSFVDRWNLEIPWTDGPIAMRRPRPAVFGNGYDRVIDPTTLHAMLKTDAAGVRTVTVAIPKNDFYLHPWKLTTNGSNTLGIDAAVSLLDSSLTPPAFSPAQTYSLMDNAFAANDAASLGILQLAPPASGEWSVRIY